MVNLIAYLSVLNRLQRTINKKNKIKHTLSDWSFQKHDCGMDQVDEKRERGNLPGRDVERGGCDDHAHEF